MLKLLELFWLVSRRRLGPEDVPVSAFLLQITVVAYMVLQAIMLWRPSGAGLTGSALISVVADVVIISAFVWLLLRLTGKLPRYQQTLTAFFGTGCVISLIALPLTYFYLSVPDGSELLVLPSLGLIAIIIWSVIVDAHIFSRAISRSLPEGVVLALVYFLINFQLLEAITT
jgi:hypothetical protein